MVFKLAMAAQKHRWRALNGVSVDRRCHRRCALRLMVSERKPVLIRVIHNIWQYLCRTKEEAEQRGWELHREVITGRLME